MTLTRINRKIISIISSRKFFYFVIAFFVFQAVWLALAYNYPMGYDEDYHLGLIKLYSHYWLPFFSTQPDDVNQFGQIVRDPSYLYHYLLSFPYRIVGLFTSNNVYQEGIFRFFNIGLFTLSLIFFKKLFNDLKVSSALSNSLLFIYILLPISAFLGAQSNYDNLLLVLTPLTILYSARALNNLANKKELPIKDLVLWFSLACLACLTQYIFLVIFVGQFIFISYRLFKNYRQPNSIKIKDWSKSISRLSMLNKLFLGTFLSLCIGLFVAMYGYNTFKYHTPIPSCDQVIDMEDCNAYSPYWRNQVYLQVKDKYPLKNIVLYGQNWSHTMTYSYFFSLAKVGDKYYGLPPLPVPEWTAVIVSSLGVVLLLKYYRTVFFKKIINRYLLFVTVFYTVVLFLYNYYEYTVYHQEVAVQGRYLMPLLLIVIYLLSLGYKQYFNLHKNYYKGIFVCLVFMCLLYGGGASAFIIRHQDTWLWNNSTVNTLTNDVQNVLKPIVLGSYF